MQGGLAPREAGEFAAAFAVITADPALAGRVSIESRLFLQAEAFASYFLGHSLLLAMQSDTAALYDELDALNQVECTRDLTEDE